MKGYVTLREEHLQVGVFTTDDIEINTSDYCRVDSEIMHAILRLNHDGPKWRDGRIKWRD